MFKGAILPITFLCIFAVEAFAQYPPYVTPTPDPATRRQIEWQNIRSHLEALDRLAKTGIQLRKTSKPVVNGVVLTQYRRSTDTELKLLTPDESDSKKFGQFLRKTGTGLIKLVADLGCDEYSVKKPAARICETFSMPGGGSAYSFRQHDYQFWKLADLLYDGKSLIAFGEMSLGFLSDLGEVPIDQLDRKTRGAEYAFAFEPAADHAGIESQNKMFVDGYETSGFWYSRIVPAVAGHTYLLRSVAYDGFAPRSDRGFEYNELDYDKRADVIVVFTIVGIDFNRTATIVWRELKAKSSPVLQ